MQQRKEKITGAILGRRLALAAIALFTLHAVSIMLFGVLGLAPSSPKWIFAPILAITLAVAGAGVGLQTFGLSRRFHWLAGISSGTASGVILGFYSIGQLGGKQTAWAICGAIAGGVLLGGLAVWTYGRGGQRFWTLAIATVSVVCAYGTAFGFGAWAMAAVSAERRGLAILLGLITGGVSLVNPTIFRLDLPSFSSLIGAPT